MLKTFSRLKRHIALGCLLFSSQLPLWSQSSLSDSGVADDADFFVRLDAYVKYGGDIDVIDGLTGQTYHSDNQVVKTIHTNFPKIMGGLHKMLLDLEIKYMNFYLENGVLHEQELIALAESFKITNFKLDRANWMVREKAILRRLQKAPFFQIKELIVWEKEEMDSRLPDNKYARNLRYNPVNASWERRVLTEWKVPVVTPWRAHTVIKNQGLNLETNKGFHIVRDQGLPHTIHSSNFKEVSVSYPIIVSRREDTQTQIDRIQIQIVENLSHLYDPFTWLARRATRFRTVFAGELVKYFKERKYKVNDREWFDVTFCNFLNDVVVTKRYGFQEIYDLYVTQQFENSQNALGEDLDLLNWLSSEKRKGKGVNKNKKVYIDFNQPGGGRWVLFDAYLRYGDKFLDTLRTNLTSLKKKTSGKLVIMQTIEQVSGVPAEKYIPAAVKAQKAGIEDYRNRKEKGEV
ncbi:MAG: hypothetical protein ACKVGW_04255 [Verrucomicrobiia bacterium]|jgi:hypothetical protein